MSSLPHKQPNRQPSKIGIRARSDGVLETLDGREVQIVETGPADFYLATGHHARSLHGDLAELRALRLKQVGGSVYKRAGSRFWQIQYPVGAGKWHQESSHTESKRDAEALLREKVYQASAGTLPGTASFEQIVDALVADARVRGRKAVARLASAARAFKARLEGSRADDCNYAVWLKYADERQRDVAPDTVHLELSVAGQAYRLAHRNGLVSRVPDFPRIKLRVRQGFLDPGEWMQLRAKLRPDFRDAGDFAFLCGAREMETLTLKWEDVEGDARIINLRETKSGRPRAIPYAECPELVAVIERRAAVYEQLKQLKPVAVITPWVFCFSAPVEIRGRQYHAAGGPLFKTTGQRGLPALLRSEWAAACASAGLPPKLFHDLRRSAARNFERAGIPRSVAMKLGGWTDKIYSRYAIGAESEIAPMVSKLSEHLRRAGLHFSDTGAKTPIKAREMLAEKGRSRTFRQAYCPPGRF